MKKTESKKNPNFDVLTYLDHIRNPCWQAPLQMKFNHWEAVSERGKLRGVMKLEDDDILELLPSLADSLYSAKDDAEKQALADKFSKGCLYNRNFTKPYKPPYGFLDESSVKEIYEKHAGQPSTVHFTGEKADLDEVDARIKKKAREEKAASSQKDAEARKKAAQKEAQRQLEQKEAQEKLAEQALIIIANENYEGNSTEGTNYEVFNGFDPAAQAGSG